jgi:hypothetical protein
MPVTIHVDVETIWLRADDVQGCPAHPDVRAGTDTKT